MGAIYINQKNKLENAQNSFHENMHESYKKILAKHKEFYYNRTIANINSTGVRETLATHDREKLYDLTKGRWKTLQKENPYLRIMHFHLPDGTSFLRMHEPDHYGDHIADIQPIIAKVHHSKNVESGFEIGQDGLTFRLVVPIFDQKNYIGALEFGSNPEQILREMRYFYGLEGALLIKSTQSNCCKNNLSIHDYRLQSNTIRDTSILEYLNKVNYDFTITKTIHYNGKIYNIYAFNLYDFAGKVSAKALFLQDITALHKEFQQTILELSLLVIILYVLILLVINYGFQKIVSALDKSNAELETIFATSKDGIAITDLETNFLYTNNAYLTMTGFTAEELYCKSCVSLSIPEDLPRAIKMIGEVVEKGYIENFEKTCIVKDGKRIIVNMAVALMPDKKRFLITTKNVTEAKKLENETNKYIKLIDENIITSSTDLKGNITHASEAFCAISGYSKEELIGQNHRIVKHPDTPKEIYTEIWKKLINDQVWEGELKNKKKDGSYYWVYSKIYPLYTEEGTKYGYTAIRTDLTDKKKIEEISITDGLTSIYNRRYFNEVFPKFIKSARRNNDIACFILIDIDYFKLYNDTYGHQMGDNALIKVAESIQHSLRRADDYCFRLGGEEFGILFTTQIQNHAIEFAETIRSNIEKLKIPHEKNSENPYITISVGLFISGNESILTCDLIYKQTDDLLYKAKQLGRNRVCSSNDV
ncbi:diguanylate cyclase [Sulfuricurvum sp.]|uniref:sensor domain-containing diguanylate cyclase n=1 Tax=Sulfuricurvum sp. TaxID=2025608 RepID=UPI002D76561D|nr:diguanylate cyclase [Sulfuricurvum sp.]